MLTTARLRLRPWTDADLQPFARLNADPDVMRYYPSVLEPHESDAIVHRINAHFDAHGWGLWAVEVDASPFIGFVGLQHVPFEAPFAPTVEIGWRLASEWWGRGLATEAARAVVDFAFERLLLDELVAFTVPTNQPSRRVMEKLGMRHEPAFDFDHPHVEEGPFRPHVFYRLERPVTTQRQTGATTPP